MADKTILGVGQMAVDGRVIENPTTFEITVEYNDISLPNTGSPGGGDYVKKSRIATIGFTATIHDYSASTLARLLAGDAASVASAAITDEALTASLGKLVATASVIDTTQTITVAHNAGTRANSTAYLLDQWIFEGTHLYQVTTAGTSAATPPTFQTDGTDTTDGTVVWADMGVFSAVLGTDFVASGAGIRTLSGAGIPDAAPIKVSYTNYAAGKVEIATQVAADVEIIFDGWNDQENVPVVGQFYKVSLKGDGGVPLISEEYGAATLSGTMLQDQTKTGAVSKYGKLSVGGVPVL